MTKTTDELKVKADRLEAVVQVLVAMIRAEAKTPHEGLTIAFTVFANCTGHIKPEHREMMWADVGEALRGYWAKRDELERETVN